MAYESFAQFYDLLTSDVDYKARFNYILELFEKYDEKPSLMLDMACGTGGFSYTARECGIDVIGVDISPDMLSVARSKSDDSDILFLCQSAQELELHGTVDGAICCLDSLNHITDFEELKKAISRISLYLEEDRLFIFDLNTAYKHNKILGNNAFVFDTDDVYLVWQNESDGVRDVRIYLDFFVPHSDTYIRESEEIVERAYSVDEIDEALIEAGMVAVAYHNDMSFEPLSENTERMYIVARKEKGDFNE